MKAAGDILSLFFLTRTDFLIWNYQKRPSAVIKGREGNQGRLVRAANIKKGCRLSKKAVKAAMDV